MDYQQQALDFAKKYNVTLTILGKAYKKHFSDDKEPRFVYSLELSRGEEFYQFEFGQSLASIKFKEIETKEPTNQTKRSNGKYGNHARYYEQGNPISCETPTMYDVLACMQKYELGTFDDFCSEFGYNDLPLSAYTETMKTYKACLAEYNAMERLFSDCMEELQEIS